MGGAFEIEEGDSGSVRDRANIVRVASIAFLCSLALSWRAYIPSLRIFALSPVIDALGSTPVWADWSILILTVGCLCWLVVTPLQRAPALGVLACTAFWVLQDLLRFQPYTYMYVFTIVVAVFFSSGSLNALKIMVASVYLWGGVHKINATFFFKTFPSLIEPFYTFPTEPSLVAALIALAIFLVPLFEAAIGLLLFFPRHRRLATVMALTMLVVVLACLGLDREAWNLIVWPWNVYLFLLVFRLFYKPAAVDDRIRFRLDMPTLATIALFTVAPAFALIGWMHSYPAFKLYSGNTKRAEVIFAQDENVAHLPNNLGTLVGRAQTLSLVDWTAHEFGLVVYPESYVFQRGAKGLCPYLSDRRQATLRIYDLPVFYSIDRTHQDFPLCKTEPN
ncbi:MAG: hypothetical protein HOP22_15600 [Nitrospiraceae bacterium]|jgi:hypothetical protein|nr:hypothetical protein [Nitrospiraceae bacterium]